MHDVIAGYVERGELPGMVTLVSRLGEAHVDAIGKKAFDGDPMRRDTIFRLLYPADAFVPFDRHFLPFFLTVGPRPRGVVNDSLHWFEQKTYPLNRIGFPISLPQFEQYFI